MKKLLSTLVCGMVLSTGMSAMAAEPAKCCDCCPPPPPPACNKMKKPPLEDKLNLTEEQKSLLKANRKASREKLKPIMTQIHEKHEAIMDIRDSELSEAEQIKQIQPIRCEIIELKKQANEVRKADMAYFESILTSKQKAKFEKIKQEHQKKMKKCNCGCKGGCNCQK